MKRTRSLCKKESNDSEKYKKTSGMYFVPAFCIYHVSGGEFGDSHCKRESPAGDGAAMD